VEKKKQIKPSVLVLGKTEKTLAPGEMPSPGQTREIPRLFVLSASEDTGSMMTSLHLEWNKQTGNVL